MNQQREIVLERSLIVLVFLVLVFMVVAANFAYVMVINPQDYNPGIQEDDRREEPRGQILDRNGNILATSIQRQSLYGNPSAVDEPWPVARKLAGVIEPSAVEIYQSLTLDGYFVWLKRKLDRSQVRQIEQMDLEGIDFVPEYERVYPQKISPKNLSGIDGEPWGLAAHVIGFVDIDNRGLAGVEKKFDEALRSVDEEDLRKGRDFVSLRLTIDKTIQHIVEEELAYMASVQRPRNAMVVVMEPSTGKIRALANWPSFDGEHPAEYPQSVRRNRAISNPVEPGSTLKVMTLAAGLDEGVYDEETVFNCPGYIYLPRAQHTLHCYAEHGDIKLPQIMIRSCNIGTVRAVEKMSPSVFYNRMRGFGFGNWTGIHLPGEARGILRKPYRWSTLSQPSMAIGQGISTTTLQLTNALGAVANGGDLMRPQIAEEVVQGGRVLERIEPFKVREVLKPETTEKISSYMRRVISEGTGRQAKSDKYTLAGKTGTAQKADLESGGYQPEDVIASFIGFGPVENPKLAVSVIVDEPQKGRYGGEVAAPVFKRIMERSLDYLKRR